MLFTILSLSLLCYICISRTISCFHVFIPSVPVAKHVLLMIHWMLSHGFKCIIAVGSMIRLHYYQGISDSCNIELAFVWFGLVIP